MPNPLKKFNDFDLEKQKKILFYSDKFWKIAEDLKIPDSKIKNIQSLLDKSAMGFLPPVEFFDKIKGVFGLEPEKDKELEKEIQSKIFFDLKSELAEMYSKEEIGDIYFEEKRPKEKLKKRLEIISNPNDFYIEKIEEETEKISFPKKTPHPEKQKTLGEELELEK